VTVVAAAVLAGVVGLVAVLAVQSTANARLSAALASERKAKNDLAAANAELTLSKAAVQARYDRRWRRSRRSTPASARTFE
jgi:hypothetical protein